MVEKIDKRRNSFFLSLGSNLGDRRAALEQALQQLSKVGRVLQSSSLYETAAWGDYHLAPFLNIAVQFETSMDPYELLTVIGEIENKLGRQRKASHYENRIIDIDILLWGEQVINDEQLTVPHPRMHLRNFVLLPMVEIAPEAYHPVLGKSMTELKKVVEDPNQIEKIE